jgi:endoglucanase
LEPLKTAASPEEQIDELKTVLKKKRMETASVKLIISTFERDLTKSLKSDTMGPTMEKEMRRKKALVFVSLLCWVMAGSGISAGPDLKTLVKDVFSIPAVTGNEELLAAKIRDILPESLAIETDNLGSVYARAGEGDMGIAVLAALDEFGWFVSSVTADGYLRLDRAVAPPHSLFDSFLMGHAVVISTKSGLQNGVIAQPAMHLLTRERREELLKSFPLDLVYLDIGAHSEEEVKARGVEYLDPVTFRPDLARLASDQWAGPSLGQKAVCAALTAAAAEAGGAKTRAPAQFVWMAQTRFPARARDGRSALGAARAQNRLQPKTVLLLDVLATDKGEKSPVLGKGPVLWQAKDAPSKLREAIEAAARETGITLQHQTGGESLLMAPFMVEGNDAVALALPVKFSQTPSEVISMGDVQALADLVVSVIKKGDWQ